MTPTLLCSWLQFFWRAYHGALIPAVLSIRVKPPWQHLSSHPPYSL